MNSDCYYIFNKKAQLCDDVKPIGGLLCFSYKETALNYGILKLATDVYACLSMDSCRFISFVTKGRNSAVITLVFPDRGDYEMMLDAVRSGGHRISSQNFRLISYADSISGKLRAGIEIKVVDAADDDNYVVCPACGVRNEKGGLPFCMECGEPL